MPYHQDPMGKDLHWGQAAHNKTIYSDPLGLPFQVWTSPLMWTIGVATVKQEGEEEDNEKSRCIYRSVDDSTLGWLKLFSNVKLRTIRCFPLPITQQYF